MTTYQKIIYAIGCVVAFMLAVVILVTGLTALDYHLNHQGLRGGYVVAKSRDDGHVWYSSWQLGDITITKCNGGEAYYFIEVRDGEATDYWKVSQERWEELEIGDYVGR